MLKEKMKKVEENIYELPKEGKMKVPGRIFASDKIFKNVEETCVQQVAISISRTHNSCKE